MDSEKYQQLIVKRAVKAANRKRNQTHADIDLQTLRELKVPTASPLSRLFIGSIGLILLVSMIYLQIADGFFWLFTLIACFGLYCLVVAIRGRRKRISEIENAIDFIDVGGSLIDAIITNLDFPLDL